MFRSTALTGTILGIVAGAGTAAGIAILCLIAYLVCGTEDLNDVPLDDLLEESDSDVDVTLSDSAEVLAARERD